MTDYTLAITRDGGGEPTAAIEGVVTYTGGAPIILARTDIDGINGTTGSHYMYSGSDCSYTLGYHAGDYRLTARHQPDHQDEIIDSVTLPDGGLARADVEMPSAPLDSEGDGYTNDVDNCIDAANQDQADYEHDSIGDTCDPDDDNDGIPDTCDTYPLDTDNDGLDNAVDDDNDGSTDAGELATGTDPLDPFSFPATVVPGDITGDGVVNVADVLRCTRIVLGLESAANEAVCDVAPLDAGGVPQGDGQLNVGDLGVLQRMALGM